MEKKKLTIRLHSKTHKRFRMHCLNYDTSAQAVLEQYILALLECSADPKVAIKRIKVKEDQK